ncbi:hypothetical protein HMPREF1210_01000 [Paenisporosarcina sp. HGH0030]|uniref:suppressor of fused domain protein n=1 Tax=Paenisporosarcina sp. HGH0030 TaxID=1078085 RepID=UPI00034E31ED|nr:suppressor of fused domain protein [Paenisporosarcina sp. HGH0030]EPD53269.1 hypothetical protein HMPREF1210_01000 [Paenisporosarcina sp. HGH0030]
MKTFIEFLEDNLGEILYGFGDDAESAELPFQIVKFSKGPFQKTTTYSTLGLSNHILASPENEMEIRQELIMVSYSEFGDEGIPGILHQVGMSILKDHSALLRGDVIGPYGSLFDDSNLEALYSSIPVYFHDSFHSYDIDTNSSILMTWLIPITSQEAGFISKQGWDSFEDILEEKDPDLVDFYRESIV